MRRGRWNWLRIVSNDGPCIRIAQTPGSAIRVLTGKTSKINMLRGLMIDVTGPGTYSIVSDC